MKIRDASTEIRYSCENPLRNHGKKSHQLTIDDFTCEPNDVLWTAGNKEIYSALFVVAIFPIARK